MRATAAAFVEARRAGVALDVYPGARPQDLASAYRIQDEAIELWRDAIGGWKVGRIAPAWTDRLNSGDRLVGPIFAKHIQRAGAPALIIDGGFAAVEGEFVAVLAGDAPAGKRDWSDDEIRALIGAVHVGIEVASSPYPEINADGPLVTISDFGNNAGLLLGPEFEGWRDCALKHWTVETRVDGEIVGAGDASTLPGGPLASVRAALSICASRGRPLKRGMLVSTGAISGVHEVRVGQDVEIAFGQSGVLSCRVAAAARQTAARVSSSAGAS